MSGARAPRVILWSERALVLCALQAVAWHAHHAPALLVGLNGCFRFQAEGEAWLSARAVLVSAGCRHRLECAETATATLFMAPGRLDHARVCARLGVDPLAPYARLPRLKRTADALVAVHGGDLRGAELDTWVERSLGAPPDRFDSEPRVERAARLVRERVDQGWTLQALAADLKLSPSRLRHLFRAQTGITPQQLKGWHRMHAVARAMATCGSLTEAAHDVGFVDSAHLSRSFRRQFGLPPSRVLRPGTRCVVRQALCDG